MTETVFSHVDRPTMVKLLSKVFGGRGYVWTHPVRDSCNVCHVIVLLTVTITAGTDWSVSVTRRYGTSFAD